MNILHVNQNLSVAGGGITQMIRDFAPALKKKGINTHCLTGEKIEDIPEGIDSHTYFPLVNEDWFFDEEKKKELDGTLGSEKIDIIHLHEIKNIRIVQYLSKMMPVVVHLHNYGWWCPGNDLYYHRTEENCDLILGWKCIPNAYTKHCNNRHPRRLIPSILKGYEKRSLYEANNLTFVTSSDYMKKQAVQAGVPKEKIYVVPYAVDMSRFNGQYHKSAYSKKFILYVGRFSHAKGIKYLIDSFALMNGENKKLIIVGDGENRKKIEGYISATGLQNNVEIVGWKSGDELSWYFENCSMVVMPSIWNEVFGIVGIEAMAASKPVIAFNVGGISQWLDESCGFLVPKKDVRLLAEKMELLWNNEDTALQMGKNGYERVVKNFTTDVKSNNLKQIYQNILNHH